MATKVSKKKLKDYFQDKKNFNKGTEYGEGLIEKSVSKFGAGRSMLASADGVLIAGNKSHQKLAEAGIENVIEVETDGKTAVVVKRTDIKSGTKKFHELALADNATSKANLNFDEQLVEEILTEEVMAEWGMELEKKIEVDRDRFSTSADSYLNSAIRQIVLYYDIKTHLEILDKLEKIGKINGIEEDNSQTVIYLIKFYEANNSSKEAS